MLSGVESKRWIIIYLNKCRPEVKGELAQHSGLWKREI